MGVSGSGKTTIGNALSRKMGIPFYDSDYFHPEANIEKMSSGIPLDDKDREPWLERIRQFVIEHLPKKSIIIATSALKETYRQKLDGELKPEEVQWIFLHGSYELLFQRISKREGHFMPESLLKSQFDALEVPHRNVIAVHVNQSVEDIVDEIIHRINSDSSGV